MKELIVGSAVIILCLFASGSATENSTDKCEGYNCIEEAICPPDSSIDNDYYDDTIIFDDLIEDIKDNERHIPLRFKRKVDSLFTQCCSIDRICKCNTNSCKLPDCNNNTHIAVRTRKASHSPGDCCDEYSCQPQPKCSEDFKDVWRSGCKECSCMSGEVLCHSIENCKDQWDGCFSIDLMKSFKHEEEWKEGDDCKECSCWDGEMKCLQIDCIVPNCVNPIKIPGQCCKACPEEIPSTQNATTEQPSGCISSALHKLFRHGEEWKEGDDCLECNCNDGTIRCESSYCKPLECKIQVKLPGQCCRVCDEVISSTQPPVPEDNDDFFWKYDNIMYVYGILLLCIILVTCSFCFFCRRHQYTVANCVATLVNTTLCCRPHHHHHHHHQHERQHRVGNFVATTRDNKYSSIQQSESTVTTTPSTPTLK